MLLQVGVFNSKCGDDNIRPKTYRKWGRKSQRWLGAEQPAHRDERAQSPSSRPGPRRGGRELPQLQRTRGGARKGAHRAPEVNCARPHGPLLRGSRFSLSKEHHWHVSGRGGNGPQEDHISQP